MGTNFYLHYPKKPACKEFGHETPQKIEHIGKSSAGWYFGLHVIDELKTLDDWHKEFYKGEIFDEYGRKVGIEEMLDIIRERGRKNKLVAPDGYSMKTFLNLNFAEICPKGSNLLMGKIGRYCVGHGEGTWDYIVGDFS